ncbi:MAG: hypothetical protein APF76_03145 [Desulfitibacter sp. BRH_c19]|nr:MAG: hypothetical protein APF76_03145 [Desulfitibacter sp. BRH_c19]
MKKLLRITIEGKTYEVEVEEIGVEGAKSAEISKTAPVPTTAPQIAQTPKETPKVAAEGEIVPAPIPGKVLSIKVKSGDTVAAGQVILILEAMKMENEITAPVDGQIKEILVSEGQSVNSGETLLIIG